MNDIIASIWGLTIGVVCIVYFLTSCHKDQHNQLSIRREYDARIQEAQAHIRQAELEQRQIENESILQLLKQSINLTNRAEINNQPENY